MVIPAARPVCTPTASSPSKPKKTQLIAQKFKHLQPTASSSSLLNSRTVSPNASHSGSILDTCSYLLIRRIISSIYNHLL
jgi:hypothetical protein